jgi:hypothetical protein
MGQQQSAADVSDFTYAYSNTDSVTSSEPVDRQENQPKITEDGGNDGNWFYSQCGGVQGNVLEILVVRFEIG